jgi:hypothetical protein
MDVEDGGYVIGEGIDTKWYPVSSQSSFSRLKMKQEQDAENEHGGGRIRKE